MGNFAGSYIRCLFGQIYDSIAFFQIEFPDESRIHIYASLDVNQILNAIQYISCSIAYKIRKIHRYIMKSNTIS